MNVLAITPSVHEEEFATRQMMNAMATYWPLLPNPDPVLKAMRQDVSVYRRLLADSTVAGLRSRRCAAVTALDARFAPSRQFQSPDVLNTCAELLKAVGLRHLVHQFMDGAFFGYRVAEIVWEVKKEAHWITELQWPRVEAKPCEWFGFGQRNELRLLTSGIPGGEEVDPSKFIVVGNNRSWDCPYGEAELAACFWPVVFKQAGMQLWVQFAEKYGMPWCIGKLPRNASQAETEALADKLASMVRDAVAVLPDDGSVTQLNAAPRDMDGRGFDRLVRFCRSEIAIALLGTDQAVEVSGAAGAADPLLADLAMADGEIVASGINQLLRRFCELNFPAASAPTFEFFNKRKAHAARTARDQRLKNAGCPNFTSQYFRREYGLLAGDVEDDREH